MSTHLDTRKRLEAIPSVRRFDDLLNESTLSDEDKEILRLHYLKGKDFRYIGDTLGYAEVTIKKRHVKALSKLSKLF
uniref:Sigma-70, region 4 n=1 Tax=Podoviridae sp. ctiJY10 TaxID=2826572 RepID=A0A8S5N585_9CAUD|nr:MAG TPA: Sigma-70, region 4 [Podoviridae sp. ctiJY10]